MIKMRGSGPIMSIWRPERPNKWLYDGAAKAVERLALAVFRPSARAPAPLAKVHRGGAVKDKIAALAP